MADLGDLLGSLMSGLIGARRMADEQTAALAEYYRDNPLLEGLSVPRIRIPELTIDMPMLIENQVGGEAGEMENPTKVASALESQMKETFIKNDIKISPTFHKTFMNEVKGQLGKIKQSGTPIMKETVARSVQSAFADTLTKSKTTLNSAQKEAIARDIRATVSAVGLVKVPVTPSIVANIKTADVKEQATSSSVVRLKITLKEEGLEWATQASESGGVIRTLQPE